MTKIFFLDVYMDEATFINQVGENISRIRKSQNMTQMALADACDFERSNMRRIESGKTNPTLKTLYKIAKALKVNPKELL